MAATTRREALSTLAEGDRTVGDLISRLSEEDLRRPATIGGGDWSATDLLGHLAHWEENALEALAQWREGRRPRIEEVFEQKRTDEINDADIERRRSLSPQNVADGARRAHGSLLGEIERMSDEEWRQKAPYETSRRTRLETLLGGILGAPKRPFGHAFAHLPDLETYVSSRSPT